MDSCSCVNRPRGVSVLGDSNKSCFKIHDNSPTLIANQAGGPIRGMKRIAFLTTSLTLNVDKRCFMVLIQDVGDLIPACIPSARAKRCPMVRTRSSMGRFCSPYLLNLWAESVAETRESGSLQRRSKWPSVCVKRLPVPIRS